MQKHWRTATWRCNATSSGNPCCCGGAWAPVKSVGQGVKIYILVIVNVPEPEHPTPVPVSAQLPVTVLSLVNAPCMIN